MTLSFTTFEQQTTTRVDVLAYLRVSDPSQAERKNSLAEQRRLIKAHFEDRLGLRILDWYVDEGISAYKDDEKREAFWAMVERQ